MIESIVKRKENTGKGNVRSNLYMPEQQFDRPSIPREIAQLFNSFFKKSELG